MQDHFTIAPRYTRAVNVERDANNPGSIEGYTVTASTTALLQRIMNARTAPGHRAWSITGPYGTGKSAFAVFLANLLGAPKHDGTKRARNLLTTQAPSIADILLDRRKASALPINGYCAVTLTAGDEPLATTILRALQRDLRRYAGIGRPLATLRRIDALVQRAKPANTKELLDIVTDTITALQRNGRSAGVLLIIDELGKYLEHAARNNEDIYLLQVLAEATASIPNNGLLLVTILHQAFEQYVAGLTKSTRTEWAKVQGRYEELLFQESPEELLHLLADAITCDHTTGLKAVLQQTRELAAQANALGLAPHGTSQGSFAQLLTRCAPLHPLVALTLVRLCKKFGQHQRSLFSFLTSREPHALATFLGEDKTRVYTIDQLYDFTINAFGNGIAMGENAARWAEVQSALERHADATAEQHRIIKTIGLLSATGGYRGLKPSRAVIEFALGTQAAPAIDELIRRSIIIHRKHNDTLALWEGSDINLDERVAEARTALPETTRLSSKLHKLWTPRPVVAKRHSVTTGTLRFFTIRYVDATTVLQCLHPDEEADGLLLYAVPNNRAEADELVHLAQASQLRDRADVLLGVCTDTRSLAHATRDLELLTWVAHHTPALQSDAVARRELRSRLLAAEQQLHKELNALFTPGPNTSTVWYQKGIPQTILSERALAARLSTICDDVYAHTPWLHNELLNRRTLSSAAAAARRTLIEAMIGRATEENLGIAGTPPEKSMYASLLQTTGIHRAEASGYTFGPPKPKSGLAPVWNAIEGFFNNCALERRPLKELFTQLQQAPYGMKLGPVPVLFCAALLARDTEVALYENGAFVPEPNVEHFERILRAPDKFEVRKYRIEGIRREVYNQFANLLQAPAAGEERLVTIVRPLYRLFTKLTPYAKQTKTLSSTAINIRDALFNARDPEDLLFKELPLACGCTPFSTTKTKGKGAQVEEFFKALRDGLFELQRSYEELLTAARAALFHAFGTDGTEGRKLIRLRATAAVEYAMEPRLRTFLQHLMEEDNDDTQWIELIMGLLVQKAPKSWTDADRAKYDVSLSEYMRNFRNIETLLTVHQRRTLAGQTHAEVLRIGVTDRHSKDKEAVVIIEQADHERVLTTVCKVEDALAELKGRPQQALAALAIAAQHLLTDLHEHPSATKERNTIA